MTMLDYPDQLACIIWFSGCTMRCPYCYNPNIVMGDGTISLDDLFEFLQQRIGLLDGVVLSGGECTLYPDIITLCRRIKDMGFLVKIDTNGSQPEVVKTLLSKKLIDYVAIDYKAPKNKFKSLTGTNIYSTFSETLDLLCNQTDIKFEVRTTVHTSLLSENDINLIIDDLCQRGYNNTYYLQKYINDVETISSLPQQKNWLDHSNLSTALPVEIRSQ